MFYWRFDTSFGVNDAGADIYETTGGSFATPNAPGTVISRKRVGYAQIYFGDCSTATMTYWFDADENAGQTSTIQLQRLGPPPGCYF